MLKGEKIGFDESRWITEPESVDVGASPEQVHGSMIKIDRDVGLAACFGQHGAMDESGEAILQVQMDADNQEDGYQQQPGAELQ